MEYDTDLAVIRQRIAKLADGAGNKDLKEILRPITLEAEFAEMVRSKRDCFGHQDFYEQWKHVLTWTQLERGKRLDKYETLIEQRLKDPAIHRDLQRALASIKRNIDRSNARFNEVEPSTNRPR